MPALDPKISPVGLWTDPSSLEAPPGGLLKAEEVILRRQGIVEPRPGFTPTTYDTVKRAIAFGDSYIYAIPSGATKSGAAGNDAIVTETGAALTWNESYIFGVETRKNLYLTTSDRVRKLENLTSGFVAYRAGVPTVYPRFLSVASSGTAVEDTKFVAYRMVVKCTDGNGVVTRSAPSGRLVYENTTGGAVDVTLAAIAHLKDPGAYVEARLSIELYRTLNETTETPTDELFLAQTVPLIAAGSGFISIQDTCPDTELGPSLYTNESQEGLAAAHLTLPAAKGAELFNGSLYLSNLTFPATQAFRVQYGAGSTRVGLRDLTGTFTLTSTDAAVADSSLFKVGQLVFPNGLHTYASDWAAATSVVRITALPNATTVRFSAAWSASTGGATIKIADSIRIGSDYFFAQTVREACTFIRGNNDQFVVGTIPDSGSSLVTIDQESDQPWSASPTWDQFRLTALSPDQTPPQVWATHGDRYNPVLPEPTVATGYSLPQEVLPNGIMWSNSLEPEHFQAANMDEAGGALKNVFRMCSVGDSLLIFKEDGLFRLSGFADSGIRFDEIDKDVRLLTPNTASVLGYKAYAWCDLGVFECGADGCIPISSQAIGNRLSVIEAAIGVSHAGAWMITNRLAGEIIMGVPASGALGVSERLYVFNRETGSWVNWFVGGSMLAGLALGDDLYLFKSAQRYAQHSDVTQTYDNNYNVTISAVSGLNVTISSSSWTPAVGDMVVMTVGGLSVFVTAITDATHFAVSSAVPTGLAAAYVSYASVITPIGATAKNPAATKCWGEAAIMWGSTYGVSRYGVSVTSSVSQTASAQTRILASIRPVETRADAYRFSIFRNHARSTRLYPEITIKQAKSAWEYEGLVLGYRVAGTRVRDR